ncbi:ATP-dependent Clp protease proteolytic subunit [Streptomyces stramineus]
MSPGPGALRPESRYIVPRFVERTSQGTREYDPYAKLFEERVIFLGHQVDDVVANDVMAQLLCLESLDPDRDISLYINSPGGSLTALTAVYDTMQFIKPDIQTVCLGQANAVAAVVLAAGTHGKRMALPNARILIQQPYTQGRQGQVSDLEIQAQEIQRQRELMETMLARHTRRDATQIREDIERDHVLTAAQALDFGLIDQVISPRTLAHSA